MLLQIGPLHNEISVCRAFGASSHSTFCISPTYFKSCNIFAVYPHQRRVLAVAAAQSEDWWVAHLPPASSAHHSNHQSAHYSKQTNFKGTLTCCKPSGGENSKFPCFFFSPKAAGECCGPRRLES